MVFHMIMYHLNVIPLLRHATIIYSKYYFSPHEFNVYLHKLSPECHDELYHGTTPCNKGLKYHLGKAIVGKIGSYLFTNYARYMACGHLKEADVSTYMREYNKLPKSYQRLLDDIY